MSWVGIDDAVKRLKKQLNAAWSHAIYNYEEMEFGKTALRVVDTWIKAEAQRRR